MALVTLAVGETEEDVVVKQVDAGCNRDVGLSEESAARGLAPGPGDCRGVARQSVAWVRVVKLTKRLVRAWALPC